MFKDLSIYTISSLLAQVLSFLVLPVFTRYLTPADYGIIALFLMFAEIIPGFLSLGLKTATYKYYFEFIERPKDFRDLNTSNFLLLLIIFVIGFFLSTAFGSMISNIAFDNKLSIRLIQYAFIYGCSEYFFGYFTFLLTAQRRASAFGFVTIFRLLLDLGLTSYFLIFMNMDYMAKVYALLISYGVTFFILLFLMRNYFSFNFSFYFAKKSVMMTSPTLLSSVLDIVNSSFDKILINKFHSLNNLAFYNFGNRFAAIFQLGQHSVQKVWSPYFFENIFSKKENALENLVKRYESMLFVFMILGLGVTYYSEELIKLMTTKEFYVSMYITPIFVLNYVVGVMGELSVNQIVAKEKLIYQFPVSVYSIIVNIGLNFLLIPVYGVYGAIIATCLSTLVSELVLFYYANKVLPLPINRIKILGIYFYFIIMSLPAYWLMNTEMFFVTKIIIKALIILSFIGIYISLGFIEKSELEIGKSYILKLKNKFTK